MGRRVGLRHIDIGDLVGGADVKLATRKLTFVPRHFDNTLSYVFSCTEAFKALSGWPPTLSHIIIVLKNS